MVFEVKDIIVIFRKIKTFLILISFKRYFSDPEKSSSLILRRHCNSGARAAIFLAVTSTGPGVLMVLVSFLCPEHQ